MSTLYARIGEKAGISRIVEKLYDGILEDYRLNRFFNSHNTTEQREALTTLLAGLLNNLYPERMNEWLDNFFLTAFARNKSKSLVGGSDFGFFSYIIEQDHPSTQYLCDGHSHLLKFMPDDTHYSAMLEHLTHSLHALNLEENLIAEVLDYAERGRNPVLGK